MEDVGNLAVFKNLNKAQKDLLIKLIGDDYSYLIQILYNVIEDDNKVLELLDIFQDQRIYFPSRKKLYKLLEKIKIYSFVSSRNFSKESITLIAKQYKKRTSQIKAIITRVDHLLNDGKLKAVEKLEQDDIK